MPRAFFFVFVWVLDMVSVLLTALYFITTGILILFRIKKNGLFNVHRVIEKEVFIADAPIQCAHLLIRESIQ